MSAHRNNPSGSEAGFALVAVLAFLLMAAAFVTPFLVGAKIQAMVTRNTGQITREKIMLRGLIEMAGTRYFELYQNRDRAAALMVRCPASGTGQFDVSFHFQDHSGLIDLNAASAELLAIGFESLAIKRDEAARLAGDVVRFRSVDGGQSARGDLTKPRGGFKHALFEHPAELQDLLAGLNLAQDDIERVFTVRSGTGTVDEVAAQGALLARLDALKAAEKFFVVSDVRRGSAVTVDAVLTFASGRRVFGSSVLAPGVNSGQGQLLQSVSYRSGTSDLDAASTATQCAAFFDPVLLNVIAKVIS